MSYQLLLWLSLFNLFTVHFKVNIVIQRKVLKKSQSVGSAVQSRTILRRRSVATYRIQSFVDIADETRKYLCTIIGMKKHIIAINTFPSLFTFFGFMYCVLICLCFLMGTHAINILRVMYLLLVYVSLQTKLMQRRRVAIDRRWSIDVHIIGYSNVQSTVSERLTKMFVIFFIPHCHLYVSSGYFDFA